jgi:hypothetical protein
MKSKVISLLDIILIFVTCGLWLFVVAFKMAKRNKAIASISKDQNDGDYELRQFQIIEKKYKACNDNHFKNLTKIDSKYSALNSSKIYYGKNMDILIALCEKDIALASEFRQYNLKQYPTKNLPSYGTFKRLAIIYEKRKEYEKAAQVCARAIKMGFYNDGTDGQIFGRLARLLRLAGIKIDVDEYAKNFTEEAEQVKQ